jgi:hydrogenase expression/formation protein HypE
VLARPEVLLGHGSGGTLTAELLEKLFLPAFASPELAQRDDSARLTIDGAALAFTTDAFVVSPLFFPGGDIGKLAVHGTVNDLAVAGAEPLHLAVAFILEEGLSMDDLRRVVLSMRAAAAESGVTVVTGDTKVVGRGAADRMFVTTSGLGRMRPGVRLAASGARPGDAVLVSGTLGDHGVAILAAREGLGLEGEVASDTAPLHDLVRVLLAAAPGTHALRDATRGGLAAVVHEIAAASGVGIELVEPALPVRTAVRGACEILGLDPLLVANEGKLVAFVAAVEADAALAAMRAHPYGRDAALVGRVTDEVPGEVSLRTAIGGTRLLERPYGELLPRIC